MNSSRSRPLIRVLVAATILAPVFIPLLVAPRAVAHLLSGTGRVLIRVPGVSVRLADTPLNVSVFRTVLGSRQYALYSASGHQLGFPVLLLTPPSDLSIPNAGVGDQVNLLGLCLLQTETGSTGALPGKADWSPQLSCSGSTCRFLEPPPYPPKHRPATITVSGL